MGLLPPRIPLAEAKGVFLSLEGCSCLERSPKGCEGRCLQL